MMLSIPAIIIALILIYDSIIVIMYGFKVWISFIPLHFEMLMKNVAKTIIISIKQLSFARGHN